MRSASFCVSGLVGAGIFACVLSGGASATTPEAAGAESPPQYKGADVAVGASDTAFGLFLDNLMHAESNGRSHAKNPRSSALGPFQFINTTFLAVVRRHFPEDIAHMSEREILALRTKREFARRAAEAFSRENMDYLTERGITPTFGHLRLAFLLGPEGAARVLQAPPSRRVTQILNNGVISANPFMRRMSAADLVARATRDVSPKDVPAPEASPTIVAGTAPAATPPPALVADNAQDEPESEPEPRQALEVADAEPEAAAQPGKAATATDAAPAVAAVEPKASAPAAAEAAKPAAVAKAPKADAADKPAPQVAAVDDAKPAAAPAPGRPAVAAAKPAHHHSGGAAVINVKCDDRQASCRRWIDRQVAALIKG